MEGKSVEMTVGNLNEGTETGQRRQMTDVMKKKNVDILRVQETR